MNNSTNNEEPVSIPGDEKLLEKMLETEKTRIGFMENVIKGMYQKKVNTSNGTIEISLTPAELSTLINAESQLFDLRRKVNGILD